MQELSTYEYCFAVGMPPDHDYDKRCVWLMDNVRQTAGKIGYGDICEKNEWSGKCQTCYADDDIHQR